VQRRSKIAALGSDFDRNSALPKVLPVTSAQVRFFHCYDSIL
jgi:hypothetical protein